MGGGGGGGGTRETQINDLGGKTQESRLTHTKQIESRHKTTSFPGSSLMRKLLERIQIIEL